MIVLLLKSDTIAILTTISFIFFDLFIKETLTNMSKITVNVDLVYCNGQKYLSQSKC